jgi:hypothetical protein
MQDSLDHLEVHVERFGNPCGAFAKGCKLIYDPHLQILGVLATDYDILLFASHNKGRQPTWSHKLIE